MATFNSITADYVRDCLEYDSNTGIFSWKKVLGSRTRIGSQAGSDDLHGYKTMRLQKKSYKLHRLAWLYVYGSWPSGDIDHINGVRSDNRISNLRDVPREVNLQNQRKAPNNKSTGVLGVYPDKKRFTAKISINNISKHLGNFDTVEEAHNAYLKAKRILHEGCKI